MKIVNRGALLVGLRQPYLDWAAAVDATSSTPAEDLEGHVSVYLISEPESMNEDDPRPHLKEHFEEIFRVELAGWSLDEAQWPRQLDLKTFLEWFDVTAQSIVVDLGHDSVEVEDTDF